MSPSVFSSVSSSVSTKVLSFRFRPLFYSEFIFVYEASQGKSRV